MQLYYLTGSQFALSNLAMRRLKVSRFSELNDPFELMAVDLSNDDERRAMQGFHDQMDVKRIMAKSLSFRPVYSYVRNCHAFTQFDKVWR